MEQHKSDPAPPYTRAPAGESGPEIIVTDTTTAAQQTQHEESEKTVTHTPQNIADNIVPIDAPAKIVPVPEAPRVTPLERLGQQPALIDCQFCQYRVTTRVQEENSSQTSMAAVFCCLFCGIIGACIPYMCKWSQDYHHFCTNCGNKVAIRPNEGPVQVQTPRVSGPSVPSVYPEAPTKPALAKTT